ncbi:uncharacterized protein A4U43_C02F3230 [Asparagus officinalis]|uniref:Golgi to ER traffic protein 4 homolog n=1 Tax=Asparagus officinalis TaxID=4686 RepID=A0A5P1FHB1_ASPOF|nr:Golgi to ER traffic protein 4 homolog [Asparagus officinalis]ONK77113.1 uncharacterized protein A4U43_C02F3230 [Asparagus officinalis]
MAAARTKRGALPPAQEVVEKLEKIVKDGNNYGALQMYKSYSVRYAAADRHTEALQILESGALVQLNSGQVTCGAELAWLFVETLIKGKFPYNEETLGRVGKIYQAFPKLSVPQQLGMEDDDVDMEKLQEAMVAAKVRVESCSSFLKHALKWSSEFGAPKGGSPQMHVMLAEYIYSESPELDMTKVSGHFIRGNDREKFAFTLVNFMGKCYPGEDDLAIARAILMYLSQGNLRDANYIMDEIKKQLESKKLDLPHSNLTNFVEYLLQTLERDAFPLFRILRQKYESSIDRDPLFSELLDEIAFKFYNVRRKSGLDSMFGDFFKMMGGVQM